jgi:integrase
MRVTDEFLSGKSHRTKQSYETALNRFEKHMGEPVLQAITSELISRYRKKIWDVGKPATAANLLTHLRAVLNWAHEIGLIDPVPVVKIPRVVKKPKGRSLTESELFRMIWWSRRIEIEQNIHGLTRFIRGLMHSGMRIGELARLNWDAGPVRLDLHSGPHPMIHWSEDGQKSRRTESTVLTPQFATLVQYTHEDDRSGLVFPVVYSDQVLRRYRIGRLISDVGNRAKIATPAGHATAHDLRRTFGCHWAKHLKPIELKTIMRHASLQTTLEFYLDSNQSQLASALWGGTPNSTPNPTQTTPDASIRLHKHAR